MPAVSETGTTPGDGSVAVLARSLLDTASIPRASGQRLRVAPAHALTGEQLAAVQELTDRVASALGLPGVDVVPEPGPLTASEVAVSRRLALRTPGAVADGAPERAAERALAAFPGPAVVLPARDGTPLRCWSAGPEDAPAVAVVSACGMPVGLAAKWMAALSPEYRVVTWESRGLFAGDDGKGLGPLPDHTLDAQSEDVLAVLDGFGIARAHVLGLCGGAVLALAAAARSDRITSMSLWHGDWELGDDTPKTTHQRDIESLLTRVARGRPQAAAMHRLMSRPSTLEGLRPDIAHYLIHPYATAELLHRYGLLNGVIMATDCRRLLTAPQPALVVTSGRDTTAHPAGSTYVARHLPRAGLRTLPEGDHLTAFDAGAGLVALARGFLRTVTVPHRRGA
ncbi:alpha/beta hydrolase [Streptomyces hirsutus]|uniref:alpha/beta fold hydrolase n=1 Tax=Streptomyces hirsutus TaxID=35620 RepID=UPI0006E1E5B9